MVVRCSRGFNLDTAVSGSTRAYSGTSNPQRLSYSVQARAADLDLHYAAMRQAGVAWRHRESRARPRPARTPPRAMEPRIVSTLASLHWLRRRVGICALSHHRAFLGPMLWAIFSHSCCIPCIRLTRDSRDAGNFRHSADDAHVDRNPGPLTALSAAFAVRWGNSCNTPRTPSPISRKPTCWTS